LLEIAAIEPQPVLAGARDEELDIVAVSTA
jgi:hypothetical protein